ncbi:MAG: large subunit ribosomal protein [Gaiellales bacterium]|nr:large subunit ribosomal protein [Gaiellales bacterium]
MKASEIHDLTDDEVAQKLEESRRELFNLRFQHATGALENTARLSLVKKQIARLLTLQLQRASAKERA